jgi:hypothetical protein
MRRHQALKTRPSTELRRVERVKKSVKEQIVEAKEELNPFLQRKTLMRLMDRRRKPDEIIKFVDDALTSESVSPVDKALICKWWIGERFGKFPEHKEQEQAVQINVPQLVGIPISMLLANIPKEDRKSFLLKALEEEDLLIDGECKAVPEAKEEKSIEIVDDWDPEET